MDGVDIAGQMHEAILKVDVTFQRRSCIIDA
jgi:hypothetical protein